MKLSLKLALVTAIVGAVVFGLTPLWPVPSYAPKPPSSLLPLFVLLAFFEALSFGLGVAFLVFGRSLVARIGQTPRLTTAAYVAIAFFLLNWWPHDNLHRLTVGDWNGTIVIEYGFHVPLMLAGAIVAWFFIASLQAASVPTLSMHQVVRPSSTEEA